MKNVRNWMAHTSLLNRLAAEDVAFLFLVNMRAMFELGPTALAYEHYLMALISRSAGEPTTMLSEKRLHDDLSRSYREIREQALRSRSESDLIFSKIANNLVMENIISEGDRCLTLLYQMFWHGLSPARLPNTELREEGKTEEKNIAPYFSFGYRLDRYRLSADMKDDFLYRLACAIYRRSFPK